MQLLRGDRSVRRAGLAGVVVGIVVAAALVVTGVLDRDTTTTGDEAAEQLVAAWERHRSGTFVVESDWRRTKRSSGSTLHSATLLVQRPPDRVLRQFGAVRGQLNGSPVRCSSDPVGGYRCFASDAVAPPYEDEVADELDALRSSVLGATAIYTVRADGDCFTLELIAPYPDPPYGRRGQLCFDPSTGALRYLRRELAEITEEQEAVAIRTEVGDADFDLSEDDDYELAGDLEPFDPAAASDAPTAPP